MDTTRLLKTVSSQNQDFRTTYCGSRQVPVFGNSSQQPSIEQGFSKSEGYNEPMDQSEPRFQYRAGARYEDDSSIHTCNSEYGKLVLLERPGRYFTKLMSSCNKSKVAFKVERKFEKPGWTFTVKVNNIVVSSVSNIKTKKEAREMASKMAWEKLQEKVETVMKIKEPKRTKESQSIKYIRSNKIKSNLIDGLDTKVDSAVATRMMKLMGWRGGPLGLAENGITEPIKLNVNQMGRAGLGSDVVRKYNEARRNLKRQKRAAKLSVLSVQDADANNKTEDSSINGHDTNKTTLKITSIVKDSNLNKISSHNGNTGCSDIMDSDYGKLVLFDKGKLYLSKLFLSCKSCNIPMRFEQKFEDPQWRCTIYINNVAVCFVLKPSKKRIKEAACKVAWEKLQNKLYTLVVKRKHSSKDDSVISVQDVSTNTNADTNLLTRTSELAGHTLGSVDNVAESIPPNLKQIRKAEMGTEVGNGQKFNRDAVTRTIREFVQSDGLESDLVFASDFTSDQRAFIHNVAQCMKLKTKSYGKKENRYIVISKPISIVRLVKNLIENGGGNENYDLIYPTNRLVNK